MDVILTFVNAFRKAIGKATDNPEVVEAIGVPIVRGPWYDASLAGGHRRRSVSCTFPVSGPHGSGFLQIKAIRNGEDGLLSFLRHHDWEILTMEAHLHVPSYGDKQKTLVKVNLASNRGPSGTRGEYEQPECCERICRQDHARRKKQQAASTT
ncbi:uncharacterized protein LOC133896613 [Phragmites australis]|uniref:uncharacterized protein LOC133896613 n=1 Tax=Phragmites australis TaxID=29695 RepID=UPI002D7A3251|nr:uncharacterized protein LOC133896613 [Phragmites australis]